MSDRTATVDRASFDDPYADLPPEAPGRLSVLQSVRRRPVLAVLPVILLLAAALAYSAQRSPKYTAEARLSVGQINLSQPGALSGFAAATQALATAYSRAVSAEYVIQRVAREANLAPPDVRSRLTATPIPDSPVFRIDATGSSQQQATTVANLASDALTAYVKRTSTSRNPATPRLLKQYRSAQEDVTTASQDVASAKQAAQAQDTTDNRRALAKAQADFATAKLQAQAASTAYLQSTSGASPTQSIVTLAPATFATNDRFRKLQIYVFVAIVAGALLGAALATLVEDRRLRRSLRQS